MTGILLINLGTPKSPNTADVRKYLLEFLGDRRVMDIPWLRRKLLVNGIIAPFRAPKSAKQYQVIWTKEGSPLLTSGERLKSKLQKNLGNNFIVELAMRYQQPSIGSILGKMVHKVQKLIVVPLYPHYASSSTGSTIEKVMEEIKKYEVIPDIKIQGPFFNHHEFIKAFAAIAQRRYALKDYEHYLFSYHGLPERQIMKASEECGMKCQLAVEGAKNFSPDCCKTLTSQNLYCYRASCYHTTRLIASALNLPEGNFTTSFQSRLGRTPWIKPYTDHVIAEKAKTGIKKILCFSPAFVADCLETLYEIRIEYNRLFKEHGGTELRLAESLNEEEEWVEALKRIIEN
jgi:protoporphyrin/coproporphyrin ferrochelatase